MKSLLVLMIIVSTSVSMMCTVFAMPDCQIKMRKGEQLLTIYSGDKLDEVCDTLCAQGDVSVSTEQTSCRDFWNALRDAIVCIDQAMSFVQTLRELIKNSSKDDQSAVYKTYNMSQLLPVVKDNIMYAIHSNNGVELTDLFADESVAYLRTITFKKFLETALQELELCGDPSRGDPDIDDYNADTWRKVWFALMDLDRKLTDLGISDYELATRSLIDIYCEARTDGSTGEERVETMRTLFKTSSEAFDDLILLNLRKQIRDNKNSQRISVVTPQHYVARLRKLLRCDGFSRWAVAA